jgi:hypothetical protein
MTEPADTRHQLLDMRERLIGNLGERIEGGDLTLLAAVNGALAAIDAADRGLADAEPGVRVIVTDIPGEPIALALYAEDTRVVGGELSPVRALALAGELLGAALRRLR